MRRLTRRLWNLLKAPVRPLNTKKTRLHFENLEDRTVPATASSTLSGFAFLDPTHTGVFRSSDARVAGIEVTLIGTTTQNVSVNKTAVTNLSGAYRFLNVLPGNYRIVADTIAGLTDASGAADGSDTVAAFDVVGGKVYRNDLAFHGTLKPGDISSSLFFSSSGPPTYNAAGAGSGKALVNFRPNNTPVISTPIAPVSVAENASPTQLHLSGNFKDPDFTTSTVTFNISDGTTQRTVEVKLFDKLTPETVANFYDLAESGQLNNNIFSRLVKNFVLQGGGTTVTAAASPATGVTLSSAIANPVPIKSEFHLSNTKGTLAMALSGSDPNSGTDQFFFNLINNASKLDKQKFTVFGRVLGASSQAAINAMKVVPVQDVSKKVTVTGVDLTTLPLENYPSATNFPTDAAVNNFLVINSITTDPNRNEKLTYSLVSNSNSTLVTGVDFTGELMKLTYGSNQTGQATITVRATDRYGAFKDQTFTVTVGAPGVTGVTIAPDNATNATKLTANPAATDPGGKTVTFTYQWQKNGTDISGATAQTLDLTKQTLAANDLITVKVTPSNGTLAGAAFTSGSVKITATNPIQVGVPVVTAVSIAPDSASSTTTLTATPTGSDPEGRTLTFSYQWQQNGTDIAGATNQALSLSGLTVKSGDSFTVKVTANDGTLSGAPFTSGNVLVTGASPTQVGVPVINTMTITPDDATNVGTLTANPSATDPEGRTVNFKFVWLQNGTPISGATTASLSLSGLTVNVGDSFTVQATPDDGTLTGGMSSKSVTVQTVSPITVA
jgi:cyclophilin family peptidyl-prolyl cis-trans isomerase